jgi:hypothetical protein
VYTVSASSENDAKIVAEQSAEFDLEAATEWAAGGQSPSSDLADTFKAMEGTSTRIEKVVLLSNLFR